MRRALPLLALALALPAAAQQGAPAERPGLVAPPPDGACEFMAPVNADPAPSPPPPPGDFISSIFLETPRHGAIGVPLNAQLRLAGFFGDLDTGFIELVIEDEALSPVAFTRVGGRVSFDAPLAPNTGYRVYTRHVDEAFCPDCQPQIYEFRTGTAEDHEAPAAPRDLIAHVLVHDECANFGFGNHSLLLAALGFSSDVARVEIAAARRGQPPAVLTDTPLFSAERLELNTNLGAAQIALNEAIHVAVTPVDLAGNAGEPLVVRTRARAFTVFEGGAVEDLEPLQCALDAAPTPALVGAAPRGALVEVAFPFEASPVALRQGDQQVALIPVEETARGQRLLPAETLGAGTWELVPVDCPFCACAGCAAAAGGSLEVGEVEDLDPPSAPVVLSLDEVFEPPFAQEVCAPDDTAILVRIEPGVDDATAAEDLRYHAALRVDDLPPVAVGRFLAPTREGDALVLRLDTAAYGRLLDQPFELELTAVDLADHESAVTFEHTAQAGGCAQSGGSTPALALLLLALTALRRRSNRRA